MSDCVDNFDAAESGYRQHTRGRAGHFITDEPDLRAALGATHYITALNSSTFSLISREIVSKENSVQS